MFVEGRKWLPLGFPLARTCTICFIVESLSQFKTNGIWASSGRREPSDQVSADRTGHPDRWVEDAPAPDHEVGLVSRGLKVAVVRQPRVLIILFILISAAISGIRSIRPLRLECKDEQRILQHLAPGVLHVLRCFHFHHQSGLLVLHLLDEAGVLSETCVRVWRFDLRCQPTAKTNGI